jgi:hypothetical protein
MKTTNNNAESYKAPSIEIHAVKVEAGFEASVPGVTINPWESDNDSLIL